MIRNEENRMRSTLTFHGNGIKLYIEVLLMDYGSTVIVHRECLYALPEELSEKPHVSFIYFLPF